VVVAHRIVCRLSLIETNLTLYFEQTGEQLQELRTVWLSEDKFSAISFLCLCER
jgi:hypothetical protein